MENDSKKAFLGIGWAFPISAAEGKAATAAYEEDVRQAILIILQTNPGERVMRPDFGAGLRDFVFEPVNPTTMGQVKTRVEHALVDWEPRIDLASVDVSPLKPERNGLSVEIAYKVRATNTDQNLVYPFYLHEGSAK